MSSPKRLYKSSDRMFAGVCGGIAEYFDVDPTLIRILAVVLVVVGFGFPILLYIIGMFVIEKDPAEKSGYINVKAEETSGASAASKNGGPATPPASTAGSAASAAPPPPASTAPPASANFSATSGFSASPINDASFNNAAASPDGATEPVGFAEAASNATVNAEPTDPIERAVDVVDEVFEKAVKAAERAGEKATEVVEKIAEKATEVVEEVAEKASGTTASGTTASDATVGGTTASGTTAGGATASGAAVGTATASAATASVATAGKNADKAASNKAGFGRSHWSFAVVVGAFLVCIGLLALLGNLVNVSFWRFWPLILVVIGIAQLFTPSSKGWSLERAGGAIVLITIGLVLLAWTLEIIPARTFVLWVYHLWPLLLVACGLYVIGTAKHMSAFNLFGSLLLSIAILLGSWYYGVTESSIPVRLPDGSTVHLSVPASPAAKTLTEGELTEVGYLALDGLFEARLQLNGGGMSTELTAGDSPALVVKNATGATSGVDLGFIDRAHDAIHLNLSKFTSGLALRAELPRAITWSEINVAAGAADIELNLTDLEVRRVLVQTGVSSSTIRLGEPLVGGSQVDVEAGLAVVKVEVPRNAAVIIYSSGLSAFDIDQKHFSYNNNLKAWCSKPYATVFGSRPVTDGKVWVIHQSGVSSFEVSVLDDEKQ